MARPLAPRGHAAAGVAPSIHGKVLVLNFSHLRDGTPTLTVFAIAPRAGGSIQTVATFRPPLGSNPYQFNFGWKVGSTFTTYGGGGISFSDGGSGDGGNETSTILRQLFDRNFTRLAYNWSPNDVSNHVGYLTPSGTLVDLTPKPGSSYTSSEPNEYGAVFRPGTSTLFFRKVAGKRVDIYKVDTQKGIGSRRRVADTRRGADRGSPLAIAFSADGRLMTSVSGSGTVGNEVVWTTPIYNRGDTLAAAVGGFPNLVVIRTPQNVDRAGNDVAGVNTPAIRGCRVNAWVGKYGILCDESDNPVADDKIFLLTVNAKGSVTKTRSLLPGTQRHNWDPIPNPKGSSFAFLSTSPANTTSLFVAPLSGHGPVRKIRDLSFVVNDSTRLIGWMP